MLTRKQFLNGFSIQNQGDYKITAWHHLVFWLIYFLFNTLRWGSYYDDFALSLKGNLIGFPIHMFLCYFTIYFLIPRFIFKRRFISFSSILLVSIFIMVVAKFYLTLFLVSNNVWPEGPEATSEFTFNYALTMMLGEFYVISFVTAIKITLDWLSASKRAARLEKEQLQTELRFLRSQISPHFFFNTLNNIYSLSLEQSKKASETVLKLSELMRYLLYETKDNKQPLDKEILCIQNYLDLERIRYGEQVKINMEVTGDIEGKKIPPMLFIPFIENAFKHGASKNIGDVCISIKLQVKQEDIYFKVSNTLPDKRINNKLEKESGGIGIENVKKRLALGYAEKDYNLEIYSKDENFIVALKLKSK
ncbi:histidine kinase [Salegentibacter sp. BDJ18]|uniref:sensor histidine kinase n=1 Tax=Salegentibacter sp. BDJ18 TaxID=2816376 RepID=UPI001AAFE5F6|nr:histidine kinase [Salegentibacter sp. BDJ18]MBO2544663.1 histidine kinase [Salegentibacter sp. BDJ18]